jgi:hypothetical protein
MRSCSASASDSLRDALLATDFQIHQSTTPLDENFLPAQSSRLTTNFANLARGPHRQTHLRQVLGDINLRLRELMPLAGYANADYEIDLQILSFFGSFEAGTPFPLYEMLEATIVDPGTGSRLPGAIGHNLSSYIRDYDFNVVLPTRLQDDRENPNLKDFGDLHGLLFRLLFRGFWDGGPLRRPSITAISVSSRCEYARLPNDHFLLGREFSEQPEVSLTSRYFARMGLSARCFAPPGSRAPLAFYLQDGDFTRFEAAELISLIAVMDTFQRIYRPEIYNVLETCGDHLRPSLQNTAFAEPTIPYDRHERIQLGKQQAKYAEDQIIRPYSAIWEKLLQAHSQNK